MPPKKKKVAENSKTQPKPAVNARPVNGVESRVGWVVPHSDKDQNYYMPRAEFDQQTRNLFTRVLKERFNLNLEADPQDAARRIFTYNRSGKDFMAEYLNEMEELDLMPDCKEKFQKREEAARELEKGLFFEMAKGSLAICPLGETEPRQLLCDTDNRVISVSEPLDQASPAVMQALFNNYTKKDVPREPREPYKPVFREKEPDKPVEPEPFTMKAPGAKPQPPKLRAFTMPIPSRPARILADKTRAELREEVYRELKAKAEYKIPVKPVAVVNDPGVFDEEEPERPVKRELEYMEEPPVKPDDYDAVKFQIETLEKEVSAMRPENDPRFISKTRHPGEFTMDPPKKPQLDYPDIPVPPTYKKLIGEPKPKFRFYKPELKYRVPEGIEDPGDKLPDTPKYRKEPIKKNPKEKPNEPVLRDAPPQPGGFKRAFSFLSSSWREQVRDYDAWTRERDEWPAKTDAYNKELREWKAESDRIEAEHKAWEAECKQLDTDYAKTLNEYSEKKVAWDEAVKDLEQENFMIKLQYDAELKEYENDVQRLGDMFEAEKFAYEKAHAEWESGEINKPIIAENKALQDKYEAEYEEFTKKETEYNENYKDCNNDPEKIKDRRGELAADYEEKLKDYEVFKERHDQQVRAYEESIEKVKARAKEAGRDPEADVKDYEAVIAKEIAYEKKTAELSDLIAKSTVVSDYDNALQQYKEDQSLKEDVESAFQEELEDWEIEHREWKAKKDAHDLKVAAFKDYDAAQKQYEIDKAVYDQNMKTLDERADQVTDQRIRENEKAITVDYPAQKKEYDREKKAYDDAVDRWEQGIEDMKKPGGLIYNWEKSVVDYNKAKKDHQLAVQKFKKEVKEYPAKLQAYNAKLDAHVKELERYNKEMSQYKIAKQKYDDAVEANTRAQNEHRKQLYTNPAYRDYSLKATGYVNGYYRWKNQFKDNFQYNALQSKNPEVYKQQQTTLFKDYEKRKKNAPQYVGGQEAREYTRRVTEHNYLKQYPEGMRPYLKALNRQENTLNVSLNNKYKKDSDFTLADYKTVAVERMYLSLVRDKAETFAKSNYTYSTDPINVLLDPAHATTAKNEMLANKQLMKRLEENYKIAKSSNRIAKSLQDGDELRSIYKDTYAYNTGKKAVKDPVFGEYHGSQQAVDKAKALEMKGPK